MSDQLRTDLRKQIYRKLHQWVLDSIDLYGMIDIDQQTALQDVLTMMTSLSSLIVSDSTMSIGEYARLHASSLRYCRENPQEPIQHAHET
jgi:hypothetical protein